MSHGRRHVVMVTDNLRVGGLQRVVCDFANGLVSRGSACTILVHGDIAPKLRAELHGDVRLIQAAGPKVLPWPIRIFIALTRTWFADRPTLLHSHQRGVALVANLWSRIFRIPVFEHVHVELQPDSLRGWSFRSVNIVACSKAVAEYLAANYPWTVGHVEVVTNAVMDPRLRGTGSTSKTRSQDRREMRMITVARLEPQKDPLKMVQIVDKVNQLLGSCNHRWIGDGSLFDEASQAAQSSGAPIVFCGERSDVYRELKMADIFILSSRFEGLPLALIEAAAEGLFLVAPDVGGCSEVVIDGWNGVLYDPAYRPIDVAMRISEELKVLPLAIAARRSREIYEDRFTLERAVQRLEEVYAAGGRR